MTNFVTPKRTYVKSTNTVNKINNLYLYTLIVFTIYLIIHNLITKNIDTSILILKTLLIAVTSGIVIECILNLFDKNKLKKIVTSNLLNTISISLIIAFFSYKMDVYITIMATLVSIIIKKKFKNINLSSALYGILLILVITYLKGELISPLAKLQELNYLGSYEEIVTNSGTFTSYLLGFYYLSPVLSIIIFFYLFYKKSIKYNLVFSYVLTILIIMLIFGLLKGMNIYYMFFQLATGNLLFLSIYGLTDSAVTPTIDKGQTIYGMILGVITCILRFIVPELSVVIALIIGPIFLTKILDNMSVKLKYNEKYLTTIISLCIVMIIITIGVLYFII